MTSENISINSNNFNVDKNGNLKCKNADINGKIVSNNAEITGGKINLNVPRSLGNRVFVISGTETDENSFIGTYNASIGYYNNDSDTGVYIQGEAGGQSMVVAQVITQKSLASQKKNFEKLKNGLDIINSTDIYKYNFKTQKDGDKKHIGFVIGENYNYSSEITAVNSENKEIGTDDYSMIAVTYKAIQELEDIIEEQNKRIEILENQIKGGN